MPFLLQAWLFLTIGLGAVLALVVGLQALWGWLRQQLAERPLAAPTRAAVAHRSA